MNKIISVVTIVLVSISINAQEISSSQKTKRQNEVKVQFRHFHDDLIINDLSNTFIGGVTDFKTWGTTLGKINIVKGEEVIVKKFDPLFLTSKGDKYARGLIFKDDRFGILNTAIKSGRISIVMQDFDYKLNKAGSQREILETNLTIDEKTLGFGRNISTQNTHIHHDKKTNSVFLELEVKNSEKRSFLTLMVLNEEYEEISRITIPAQDHKKGVQLVTHKVLENGEAFAIVEETDGYGDIHAYNFIHFANDGSNNHVIKEILPAKKSIINSQISENSFDDNVIISILSSGTLKDKERDSGALTAYKYNLKTGDMDYITYALNKNQVLTGNDNNLQNLRDMKTEFLPDGSVLFYMFGAYKSVALYHDRSIIVIKVDKNGEFQWLNTIGRNSKSVVKNNTVGYLTYLNGEGDLEVIFNTSKSALKGDSYSPNLDGNPDYLNLGGTVKPAKAKINLETGEMEIKAINFASNINSFSFPSAREMEEVGVYKIMHSKGKDTYISTVDFKDQ
ncbi:hypothetical protein [Brumimicrobium mesophilum]|uniref:hypothetical protein n=1 Tax=Brumimicrobium mesophilum TaxID=392717 RepID=UPI00131DA314|nr:hypothetical protein [Brumimicrobium mesophilum]